MSHSENTVEITTEFEDSESVTVGDSVGVRTEITSENVEAFAALTGDQNPLHLDEEFAASTQFGGRIAHGSFVSAFISTALAELPGTIVYLAQDTEFKAPVPVNSVVRVECRISEHHGDSRYSVDTTVFCEGDIAVAGEATILTE